MDETGGEEWWQKLITGGLNRAIDAQFREPVRFNAVEQPAMDAQGNVYINGQPARLAAASNAGKVAPWMWVAGGVAVLGVLVFALKR